MNIAQLKTTDPPNYYTNAFAVDAGLVNPITTALQEFYTSVMNTSWNQLDPNELTPLKKQVDEIRSKKKY